MGYKLIGYKEKDLFEFYDLEDYEKFAEDPGKGLTEGLVPVYVDTERDIHSEIVEGFDALKNNYA